MTHDVTVSSAECAECKQDHRPDCYRNETVGHYGGGPSDCNCGWRTLGQKHLQAQKDALYTAALAAFGPEPIKYLLQPGIGKLFFAAELTALADALRSGLGMPPQEHELQILTTKELRAQLEAKK